MRARMAAVVVGAGAAALAASARAANPLRTAERAPVHWAASEIRVAADPNAPSRSLASESVAEAIAEAGAAWNAQPELKLRIVAAPAGSDAVAVRVRFCKGTWTAPAGLLANTEFEADPATGVVTSAVIVVDECDYRFVGPSEVEDGAFDLQAVLTHELGHVLGLGHSADPKAVMFPSTGTVRQRRPTADDRSGLAALYGAPTGADAGAPMLAVAPRLPAPSLVPRLTPPLGAAPVRAPGEVIGATRLEAGDLVLYTGELVVLPAMESAEPAPATSPPGPRAGDRLRRRPPTKRGPPRAR